LRKREQVLKAIEKYAGPYLKKVYELVNKGSYHVLAKALNKISKTKILKKMIVGKIILKFVYKAQLKLNRNKNATFPILIGLAYFVIPTDVIADFIPVAGYVDDAYVITLIMSLMD